MTPYAVFAKRAAHRILRTPETIISTAAFPLILLLTMLAVFSTAVEGFNDGPYAQRLVPGLVVGGLLFGSIGTATGFFDDLHGGFVQRIRSMPVPFSAPLVGTVIAETVRAAAASVVLVSAGYCFGFRFATPAGAIGFMAIAALGSVSIVWVGLALATVATTSEALAPPLGALFLVLLFFSGSLVPKGAYPGWAQPVVTANPASVFTNALDDLARGEPFLRSASQAAGWAVGLTAVFGFAAVRGMSRSR